MQNGNMEPEILCKMQTWSSQTPNTHTSTREHARMRVCVCVCVCVLLCKAHGVRNIKFANVKHYYFLQITNMENKIPCKMQTLSLKYYLIYKI